ncbi:DUF6449 domain-containing protein [Butyrivibrio sp. VCB2006]|uniref:DUF6449 domain-containing protein n=1 Tax=Butyrivibrio sp. VCB2006 TaxID=1280679 RepID=UPI00049223B3|nr:DUF6449 domain-containing protein [Butyrivibrio sp. VCB2006]
MTSASLSLSNRISNHKKYITRTLWSSILGFVLMAVYYVFGTIVMVSRSINFGRIHHQAAAVTQHEKYLAVTRVLGLEQVGWVLVAGIAIAFAFQGFSYLFNNSMIDFYLSQPTTRRERIRKNYLNAISTFVMMYLSVNVIALIIAACMGAVNSVVLLSVLIEFVRVLVLFFAFYNITILAIMLTGNMFIAMLVLAFFLAISLVFGLEITSFKEVFFATYSARGEAGFFGSPLYDRISAYGFLMGLRYNISDYSNSFVTLEESICGIIRYDLDTLFVGIIAFVFVLVFSKFRRAEHAGKAIVYRPFRWVLKIVSCILIGLGCGYIFYSMNGYIWNGSRFYIMMFVVMVLATIISGCIIEGILEGNIRSILNGKAQTIMALAVVSLIFVIFRGDLIGYDSYIPDASKVESCALLSTGYNYRLLRGNKYSDFENNPELYMEITDVENFNKLVKEGLKNQKVWKKSQNDGTYIDCGWNEDILYRLKNGKVVYRSICIPYNMDTKVLSAIIDSPEYREGYFEVFHDDEMREYDLENAKTRNVQYISFAGNETTKELSYAEISDAYMKDVENNFTFEMASTNRPIGQIEFDNYGDEGYCECTLNVYDCYTNTIELLKKYGIYTDSEINLDIIESIEITNYYPGHDIEKEDVDSIEENTEYGYFTYTEKDQIRDIIENVVCNDFYSRWYRSYELTNNQFSVIANVRNGKNGTSTVARYYSFEMGKVPSFVYSDTQ